MFRQVENHELPNDNIVTVGAELGTGSGGLAEVPHVAGIVDFVQASLRTGAAHNEFGRPCAQAKGRGQHRGGVAQTPES